MNMNQYKVHDRSHPAGRGGVQKVYRFPNQYGASVIRTSFSYGGDEGLWELGVVKWNGEKFALTYDTPITDDVIGHLSDEQVDATLEQIMELDFEGKAK
jgi:hypothetical protein